MPRPTPQRKIIVADSEEELALATAEAQRPGEPEPDDPEPPQPEPEEPEPDEETENGDSDEEEDGEESPAEAPADPPGSAAVLPLPFEPLTTSTRLSYENRIFIVDAWQYPGSLKHAPTWVDRNWVGYAADYDPLRQLEPGPCLRVPLLGGVIAIARIGDYVVTQEVKFDEGLSDLRLEVWEQNQFEKFFMKASR
jgi:hypothetical protein